MSFIRETKRILDFLENADSIISQKNRRGNRSLSNLNRNDSCTGVIDHVVEHFGKAILKNVLSITIDVAQKRFDPIDIDSHFIQIALFIQTKGKALCMLFLKPAHAPAAFLTKFNAPLIGKIIDVG